MATTKVSGELVDLNEATSESGLKIPSGTEVNRPATDVAGMIRNNTNETSASSASCEEYYNGTAWKKLNNVVICTASTCSYPTTATALYQLNADANDTCGSHNATASGITYTSGYIGNAATYTGTQANTGSKIYVSNNIYGASISIFSISLWIKCTNTTGEIPISGNGGTIGGTTGYAIYLNSGRLALTFRTNPNQDFYADTTSINDNAWHHVALTFNNGVFVLYLDNSVNASGTTTNFTGNPTPTFDTYFGNRWNRSEAGVIAGQIDQIRVFGGVILTASQVTDLYNETC